jgi:hypothetical protein
MANRVSEKRDSGKTWKEVKALIDGLPMGLDLANRLAIFKEYFLVSKGEYRRHKGPTAETLLNATTGISWPNHSTLDSLCKAAASALMGRYQGLAKRDAARAGKWLSNGPVRIASPQPELNEVLIEPSERTVGGESRPKAVIAAEGTVSAGKIPSSHLSLSQPSEVGFLQALDACIEEITAAARPRAKKPWSALAQAVGLVKRYLEDMEWMQRPPDRHPFYLLEGGQIAGTVGYFETPVKFVAGKRPPQTGAPVPFPYTAKGFEEVERQLHTILFELNQLCEDSKRRPKKRIYRLLRIDVREIGRLHGQLAGPYRRQGLASDLSLFDPLPWIDDGGIKEAVKALADAFADEAGLIETAREMGLIPQ